MTGTIYFSGSEEDWGLSFKPAFQDAGIDDPGFKNPFAHGAFEIMPSSGVPWPALPKGFEPGFCLQAEATIQVFSFSFSPNDARTSDTFVDKATVVRSTPYKPCAE